MTPLPRCFSPCLQLSRLSHTHGKASVDLGSLLSEAIRRPWQLPCSCFVPPTASSKSTNAQKSVDEPGKQVVAHLRASLRCKPSRGLPTTQPPEPASICRRPGLRRRLTSPPAANRRPGPRHSTPATSRSRRSDAVATCARRPSHCTAATCGRRRVATSQTQRLRARAIATSWPHTCLLICNRYPPEPLSLAARTRRYNVLQY